MRYLVLALLLGGCSNVLGIHPLSDADSSGGDDAPTRDGGGSDDSGNGSDGGMADAMIDAGPAQHIGNYAIFSAQTAVSGNFIIARQFTVGGTTVITGAGAYLKSETPSAHIKLAIYNDNATSPFTRRVMTADITLDGTPSYNESPLAAHTLQAGTYWIVLATEAALEIGSLDSNNAAGAAASLPYANSFPTTYNPQPTGSTTTDPFNLYLIAQP